CDARLPLCTRSAGPIPALFPYTTLFRSESRITASRSDEGSGLPRQALIGIIPGSVYAGPGSSAGSRPPFRSTTSRRSSWKKNTRSEEHTSELQSRENLVCRLLLENKEQP